jgi:hypothetical protein
LFLFFGRRLPPERSAGLVTVLAASILFFLVLALGSTYAGVRHALPVIALLAIFGGLAVRLAFSSNSKPLKGVVVAALVAAAASALPVMRPWEYFNEIIGGTKNGYFYFSDEGVDLWQRGKELDATITGSLSQRAKFRSSFTESLNRRRRHGIWTGL